MHQTLRLPRHRLAESYRPRTLATREAGRRRDTTRVIRQRRLNIHTAEGHRQARRRRSPRAMEHHHHTDQGPLSSMADTAEVLRPAPHHSRSMGTAAVRRYTVVVVHRRARHKATAAALLPVLQLRSEGTRRHSRAIQARTDPAVHRRRSLAIRAHTGQAVPRKDLLLRKATARGRLRATTKARPPRNILDTKIRARIRVKTKGGEEIVVATGTTEREARKGGCLC
jgi:hypothetical protein